jgi:hypothetical protein
VSACNGEDPSFDGTSSDPDGGWHEVLWVKHGPPTRGVTHAPALWKMIELD